MTGGWQRDKRAEQRKREGRKICKTNRGKVIKDTGTRERRRREGERERGREGRIEDKKGNGTWEQIKASEG